MTAQPSKPKTSRTRRGMHGRSISANTASYGESDNCAQQSNVPLSNDDPSLYLNRELSWISFNQRVLNEARHSRTPLLERLKFLAIVSANIDEFYMKRPGQVKAADCRRCGTSYG